MTRSTDKVALYDQRKTSQTLKGIACSVEKNAFGSLKKKRKTTRFIYYPTVLPYPTKERKTANSRGKKVGMNAQGNFCEKKKSG